MDGPPERIRPRARCRPHRHPAQVRQLDRRPRPRHRTHRPDLPPATCRPHVLQPTPDDPTRYAPDPLYTRFQAIRDLLDEHDREELHHHRTTIRDQLDTIQSNYDASSPEALREHAAHMATASDTRTLRDVANEWDTLRYRHTLVETALEHAPSDDSHCSNED